MTTETTTDNSSKMSMLNRGIYMAVLLMAGGLATSLVMGIALFQFLSTLLSGTRNHNLLQLSKGLGRYLYQVAQFLLYNSEEKPYPFSAWPTEAKATSDIQTVEPTTVSCS